MPKWEILSSKKGSMVWKREEENKRSTQLFCRTICRDKREYTFDRILLWIFLWNCYISGYYIRLTDANEKKMDYGTTTDE